MLILHKHSICSYCTLSVWVGKMSARRKLIARPGTTHTTVVSRMTSHTLFSDRQLRAVPKKTHIFVSLLSTTVSLQASHWAKLTYEWEISWKDAKYAIALHSKQYGKVDGQAPPYEEVIDSCPVVCVKPNLGYMIQKHIYSVHSAWLFLSAFLWL